MRFAIEHLPKTSATYQVTPVEYNEARHWLADGEFLSLIRTTELIGAIRAGLGASLEQADQSNCYAERETRRYSSHSRLACCWRGRRAISFRWKPIGGASSCALPIRMKPLRRLCSQLRRISRQTLRIQNRRVTSGRRDV